MPIYEFVCEDCGTEFEELLRKRDEASQVKCKECGSQRVKRLMSVVSSVVKESGGSEDRPRVAETHRCSTGTCTHLELPGHSR